MKKILAIPLLMASFAILCAQATLTIEIDQLESNKGVVIVALLDKYEKDVVDQTCKITDNKCALSFKDVKYNRYAIRFFHDENENRELDTNFLGIPKEGFGFSNDAMGKFGPKDFSEWLFEVSGDTTIRMTATNLF